jgi:hypothetical protein
MGARMITPANLNLALRLVFAYQYQPHLLDDAEVSGR